MRVPAWAFLWSSQISKAYIYIYTLYIFNLGTHSEHTRFISVHKSAQKTNMCGAHTLFYIVYMYIYMCAVWCISPDHISYLAWQACQYLNDALTTQDKLPTQREVETLFESLLRLSQPPSQLYFALFFSFFFPLFSPFSYFPLSISVCSLAIKNPFAFSLSQDISFLACHLACS